MRPMPNPEEDELRRRLTEALDKVEPRFSTPRYLSAQPRSLGWRLAPAVIATLALSVLVVSAYARTGSVNPAVWTQSVVNVVAPAAPSPTGEPTKPTEQPTSKPDASHEESPEPAQSPEPRESPEPSQSPEPTQSPEPAHSPEPAQPPEPTQSPAPTPTPDSTSDSGDSGR